MNYLKKIENPNNKIIETQQQQKNRLERERDPTTTKTHLIRTEHPPQDSKFKS